MIALQHCINKPNNQLRKLISDKKYAEGDLFQKEMELAKRRGISINTLRQAFANLVRDGLLERKKYLLL